MGRGFESLQAYHAFNNLLAVLDSASQIHQPTFVAGRIPSLVIPFHRPGQRCEPRLRHRPRPAPIGYLSCRAMNCRNASAARWEASVAQTSVFEVSGSSSGSRWRIQRQIHPANQRAARMRHAPKVGLDWLNPYLVGIRAEPGSRPGEVAVTTISPGCPVVCTLMAATPEIASMCVVPPSNLPGPSTAK